jgi:hypothetical protein
MSEGMTLSCDDVNARLLDLIYGEGSASERSTLEGHVEGCARCRTDLEALGRARATVRARLDGDAPPPRARARILEAARQALATAPAAAAPAAPARAAPARVEQRPFWERLRARWTLPTLATVGAVALMVLASRVLLNPHDTYERGRQALAPEATLPARPAGPGGAGVVVPTPQGEAPAERALAPEGAPPRNLDELGGVLRAETFEERRADSARAFAQPPSSAAASAKSASHERASAAGERVRGTTAGKGGTAAAPPPAAAPAAPRVARDDDLDVEFRAPAVSPAGRAQDRARGGGAALEKGAPAAAEPAPAPRARLKDQAARSDYAMGVGSAVANARPRRETEAKPEAEAAAETSPAAASDEEEAMAGQAPLHRSAKKSEALSEEKAKRGPPESAESMSRRADRLYAEHRWREAAALYEELLRRYPGADGVARWRVRVTTAQRAATATPQPAAPPAAATTSARPLSH